MMIKRKLDGAVDESLAEQQVHTGVYPRWTNL